MVEKPFFLLLSELSNFVRNHLHLQVPVEVGVSDIPRCINDDPKYLVLKSLNDINCSRKDQIFVLICESFLISYVLLVFTSCYFTPSACVSQGVGR